MDSLNDEIKPRIRNKLQKNIENQIGKIPKTKEEKNKEKDQWLIESKIWIVIICVSLLIIIIIIIYFVCKNNETERYIKNRRPPGMNNIPTKLYKKYNNNVKNKEYSHQSLRSKIQQKIFDKNNKINNNYVTVSDEENKLEIINDTESESISEDEIYSETDSEIDSKILKEDKEDKEETADSNIQNQNILNEKSKKEKEEKEEKEKEKEEGEKKNNIHKDKIYVTDKK